MAMWRWAAVAVIVIALARPEGTLAQELKLARTAESGVETLIAYERSWDGNCNAQHAAVTITRKPSHGTVAIVQGTSTIPDSTPRSGSTGICAGKPIVGNQLMYRSMPGYEGTDTIGYDVVYGNGRKGSTTITVSVVGAKSPTVADKRGAAPSPPAEPAAPKNPIARAAEKRIALVIGNGAYRNVPRLPNPASDASLMADTLRSLGFVLVGGAAQLDLDKGGLDRAAQDFGRQLRGAAVGLFYYAGHGLQVRGGNYLVPVDANPTTEADVDFQMLDTNLVLRQMESAGTKLNLVILDACRNNPFGGRGLRAATGGLAQMQAPEGTLISFATQPGNVAQDGEGGNSPFTGALARTMRKAGLDIFQTFNEVGLAVKRATGGAQQPWVSSSPIDGTFYFVPPAAAPAAPAASSR